MVPAASMSPAQVDDILRIAAYHRTDFDLAVVWFPAREHAAVTKSISSIFRESTTSLRELDRLPLELVNAICLQLDMESLFAFRQVNLRARQIVTSLPEYKLITTHALNCLCALLRTKSASWVTLLGFHRLLCQKSCSLCGDEYGDLAHLVNWTRYCSACLRRRSWETRMMPIASAKRLFKLSTKSLNGLRNMKTLPGTYSMEETTRKNRLSLVSAQAALLASRREGPKTAPTSEIPLKQPYTDFMACCALPYYDPKSKSAQNGVSCAGCQLAVEESTRSDGLAFSLRDKVYSRQSFLEHFQECEEAQLLWRSSGAGSNEPANMPYACKRGGYFSPRQ